jgi:GrpB-like predicted nucleotidyltransferase (UPF0157 family)
MIEPLAPTIHHIGSTAVVGFAAKPVIDILIEIERADSIAAYNSKTYEIGYKVSQVGVSFTREETIGLTMSRFFSWVLVLHATSHFVITLEPTAKLRKNTLQQSVSQRQNVTMILTAISKKKKRS